VLLHGVTNRWQTWLPVLPLLGWRGHGRSGRAADGLFVDLALADVLPKISCPTLLIQGNPDPGGVIEYRDMQ
jgi:hypothetical protein